MRRMQHHFSGGVGLALVTGFFLSVLLAGAMSPQDPYRQEMEEQLLPPSWEHLLGTDDLGRDLLSRVLHGARISCLIALVSVNTALILGVPWGLACGYFGGRIDLLAMRLIDVLLAFPSILLAILIMAALGPSLSNVMVAVGLVHVPLYARQVRASVLVVRDLDFVAASRAAGATPVRVLARTILPNVLSPIIVLATLGTGTAILEAAGLSFLGLGGEPDIPEWGNMLTTTRQYVRTHPWVSLAPGFAITLTVLGFNLLGDHLRDALDPRTRGRL
ncbi:MAG: ABC transporter permease [Planctomycetes bacterium]|nr:ABC transporter permease [Planctomycetota bacterium]